MEEETAIRLECLKLAVAESRYGDWPDAQGTSRVMEIASRLADFVISGKVGE